MINVRSPIFASLILNYLRQCFIQVLQYSGSALGIDACINGEKAAIRAN
jgi:hypothetical protein